MRRVVSSCVVLGSLFVAAGSLEAGGPADFMMLTRIEDRLVEGQPLEWTDQQMFLLGRDGQLHEFAPQDAEESRKTGPAFRGYTTSEIQGLLRDEFDNRFEVSTTHHFVVVHPRGEWSAWASL